MNLTEAKKYILNRLEKELSNGLHYHGVHHTKDVYHVMESLLEKENMDEEDAIILKTSALYHDTGFLFEYHHNEDLAIGLCREVLPGFGYSEIQIEKIAGIIHSTKMHIQPESSMEKLMSDADFDYLGRTDVFDIAASLHEELKAHGYQFSPIEWINIQIDFLKKHRFYSATSLSSREEGKQHYLNTLLKELSE